MKKTLLILALTMTSTAFAAIPNSKYEDRHQVAIEKAISKNCGNFRDLVQVGSTEEVIMIDNGIRDIKYKTILTGLQRLDQNIFDSYTISVESNYADMYDHEAREWGAYSVDSVFCQMQ